MPSKAMMSVSSDSSNLIACAHNERPDLRLTPKGQQAIKCGPTRGIRLYNLTQAALDALAAPLPMDALPQIEIKTAPPCGDDYGGF